jgi:Domain of unknown function (DUF4249)
MNKISSILAVAIVSCSIFSACQKDLTIKIDSKYTVPKIVLNAVLKTDSTITVHVSKSVSTFSTDVPSAITNATIDLYEDGLMKATLINNGNGLYTAAYKPLATHSYTIKASASGFTAVEATTTMPKPLPITIVSIDSVNEDFTIHFADPSTEDNYYSFLLNVIDTTKTNTVLDLSTDNTLLLENNRSPILSSLGGRHGDRKLQRINNYLSDGLFNGQANDYMLSFNTVNDHKGHNGGPNQMAPPPPPGVYTFTAVFDSPELFKYFKTMDEATNPNPFADAAQIYSNVKNGLGVVASSTRQSYVILVKKI